jgi:RNA polymerase sigma-70 factor (ECF subfamily)
MADSRSDREILRRSLDDPVGFGVLFERHYPAILRYLERRVGNIVGEELAAESFLVAFERRRTFDASRGEVRPWLFGIATNLLRNERRTEQVILRQRGGLIDTVGDSSIDDATDRVDANSERSNLLRALARLEDNERDVVFLTALGELTPREIAGVLGIPPSTVRTRLWRARKVLRTRLRASDESTPEYLRPLHHPNRYQLSISASPDGGTR